MPPKGNNSSFRKWTAIIAEFNRLYDNSINIVITNSDELQKVLTIRTRLSKIETLYDEVFFSLDPELVDQDLHSNFTDKFTELIAKLTINCESFENQQQMLHSQNFDNSDMPHESHHDMPTNVQEVVSPPPPQRPVGVEPTVQPPTANPASPSVASGSFPQPMPQIPMQWAQSPMFQFQGYKLPDIPLPSFSGEFDQWIEFRSSFSAIVVDNHTVASSTKFQYLKQALSGEALHRIANVPFGQFDLAWSLLKQRYDNPRLIADTHVAAILDPPSLNSNLAPSWRSFIDHCKTHIHALESIDLKVDIKDLLYLYIVISRFDSRTLRDWERYNSSATVPSMEQLWDFMEAQHKVAQAISVSSSHHAQEAHKLASNTSTKPAQAARPTSQPQTSNFNKNKSNNSHFNNCKSHNSNKSFACLYCKDPSHNVFKCSILQKIDPAGMKDAVRRKNLCFNCLKPYIFGHSCLGSCHHCGKQHHTVLHEAFSSSSGKNFASNSIQLYSTPSDCGSSTSSKVQVQSSCSLSPLQQSAVSVPTASNANSLVNLRSESSSILTPVLQTSDNQISDNQVSANCASHTNNNHRSSIAIMPTAEIIVVDSENRHISCRALLDTGSDTCLMSENLAARLALPIIHRNSSIHTVAGNSTKSTVVHAVQIKSKDQSWSTVEECLVVNRISLNVPPIDLDLSNFQIPGGIKLADPCFYKTQTIDLLLGTTVLAAVMTAGQIFTAPGYPVIQNTLLGWIVFGALKLSQPIPSVRQANSNFLSTHDISEQLEKFWKIEELSKEIPPHPEEVNVEEHYNKTTYRLDDGRFVVSLPRKDNFFTLGQSEFQARKRFISLEKRFSKSPDLKSQYVEFMREYEELNHMSLAEPAKEDEKVYFIPHHAVFKPDSTTTKLRVVFDASAKTNTGTSLNELLFKGPTVQPELFDIVLRFRIHKIAFTSDVAKMYRQVLLNPSDRNFHRILWRSEPSSPIQQFCLNTVTYGTAPAAYLATRTLNKLAELESNPDSAVFNSIHNDFYVDDCISGAPTVNQAMSLAQELISLLEKGGFELRKFMSCSPELLNSIPSHLIETSCVKPVSEADDGVSKALGLIWNSKRDELSIASNLNCDLDKASFTKRELLSVIASVYDPLGLVSPIVILPKILLQKLWLLKLDWDDQLPSALLLDWLDIFRQLPDVSQICIPRCVLSPQQDAIIELHGFSDASSVAYGACIYVRSISNQVQTRLLCSKSRIAPLKLLSIPKLELQAALLLSRLINRVLKAFSLLNINISKVFLWSDSTTVCSWIRASPDRKDIFVAVRVAEIQETTSHFSWNHVRTANNPADVISRGSTPTDLNKNNLWWYGPKWLAMPNTHWDSFSTNFAISSFANVAFVNTSVSVFSHLFDRISNPFKIIRVVAYCRRFIHNMRSGNTRISGELSVSEIEEAEIHVVKIVQEQAFGLELHRLRSNEELDVRSNIHSLSPFIHEDGLLRVGGRLIHADVPFDFQHQMLLPSKHKFTKAMVIAIHHRLCHAGVQATMASLRQRFWIPSTRRVVKGILRTCIKCFRFSQSKSEQIMGQLPAVRVNIGSPFLNVGVDYMGPFNLRLGGPKSRSFSKAHIALFICMVTRAVHLEVVTELSTKAFLAALTRFASIRGIPSAIYSDNGTAFVGANTELQALHNFLADSQNQRSLQNSAALWKIQWNFIPPRSPHFGGLWERSIKSFKNIFKIITLKLTLDFEEMYTLSAQIGAILNSRPLVPLSEDPLDLAYLSPGHFLIGRPLNALPSKQSQSKHVNHLARWQKISDLNRQLWERWSQEYLVTLQQKNKWTTSSENVTVGTLVLLKDPGSLPTFWKLGRITEVIPGEDGKVRVVRILTNTGVFKRPISNIAPLPMEEPEAHDSF